MDAELLTLAGDLGFEKKRCVRAIQELQGMLLTTSQKQFTSEMFERTIEQLEQLNQSTERLSLLIDELESSITKTKQVAVSVLFDELKKLLLDTEKKFQKPLDIQFAKTEITVDSALIEKISPILRDMIVPLVEFAVEDAKERRARNKRVQSRIEMNIKAVSYGYRILIFCDGNGLLPPFANEHGLTLATLGIRARFDGKPGMWCAWNIFIPKVSGAIDFLPFRLEDRWYSLPASSITNIQQEGSKWHMEVSIGTRSEKLIVDEVQQTFEAYLKKFQKELTSQGRYMGIILFEKSKEGLCLVMDPATLVYGVATKGDRKRAS